MKTWCTIFTAYCLLDAFFIVTNHFDLYEQPKPFFFIAWYQLVKDAIVTIYYGNDGTVLVFYPAFLFLCWLCFVVAGFLVDVMELLKDNLYF